MIESIIWIYVSAIIHTVIHELSHWACAKFNKLETGEIRIGSSLLSIRIGNIAFSPIVFGGYVEVKEECLLSCKPFVLIAYFLSGIFTNLIISIFVLTFGTENYLIIFGLVGFLLGVTNAVFLISGSDTNMLIKYLKIRNHW